jgi:hypothetical protein
MRARPALRPASSVLAAALLVLALLLAGCGNDNKAKNAYVSDVNDAQTSFVTTFQRIRAQLTTTSTVAEDRATLTDFSKATDQVVRSLQAIKPPKEVVKQHASLIAAVRSYKTAIDKARARVASSKTAERQAARTDLSTAVDDVSRRIAAAIRAINERLHA